MGIKEEVVIKRSGFSGCGWSFWDDEGERFLFNYHGDSLFMHKQLTNMSRDERLAFAYVYNKLSLTSKV